MSDRKMTKEEAIMKAAKDDFDRINALPDSERRQEAIRSIYGGMETFSPPAPVSIDDKVHAVSLASEVPGHEKRGVIGHYKIHHNGDREGTVLGNWDWERVVADAGLTGKWMVLHFTDAADFERDWSMLEAAQDSLREHSKLLKQRDSELADLRAEVEALKAKLVEWAGEAYDDVGSWAAYAEQYFQNKHGLSDDLDKWAARKSGISIDAARLRKGDPS